MEQEKKKRIRKIIILCAVALAVVILALESVVIVQAGHTGVVVTTGAVGETVMEEGMHLKAPFAQTIVQMDNRTQKVEADGTASSKDLQIITYVVALNYKIVNDQSAQLYKFVGRDYEHVIIAPAIQESIKAVTAGFTAEELITKRQQVSEQIKSTMSEKITPYGLKSEVFNIVNFDFSEEFNKAVEAKQTAQQAALKAEQDLARIEIEARQKVEQARAEAQSIEMIQDTLAKAPEYIEYIKWSKWDGKLPNVLSGDSSQMILDIGNSSAAGGGQQNTNAD
ncbi:MAG: prohibitin family protein [Christensenellales bacterium]|jgi:prohibitin 2